MQQELSVQDLGNLDATGCSMVEKRMHLLEEPTGTGEVYESDDWLAEVHYSLMVRQEVIVIECESGAEELPGLRSIRGQIQILSSERDLMVNHEDPYLLRLSDGRTWDFRAIEGAPARGVYEVASATARGLSWGWAPAT